MAEESQLGAEFTLAIFKLNGQMLAAGEKLARPAGITVAWWQVLGAVLREPLTAVGIARQMGITRQAVQRIANRLIAEGLSRNHLAARDTLPSESSTSSE